MEILQSIGLDATVAIQFVVFFVVYLVLSNLVFRPYFQAFVERKKRTVGNQEAAERLVDEAQQLETEFQIKARDINSKFKGLYDEKRTEALREYDRLVNEARSKANQYLTETREKIKVEVESAQKDLLAEVPLVKSAIVSQLLGREAK